MANKNSPPYISFFISHCFNLPKLMGRLPDAPPPMHSMGGTFSTKTLQSLHIIFHLISPSSAQSPSRSSSSIRFLPSPPHPLLAIHPQHAHIRTISNVTFSVSPLKPLVSLSFFLFRPFHSFKQRYSHNSPQHSHFCSLCYSLCCFIGQPS